MRYARAVIVAEGLELPVMVGSPADFGAVDMKTEQHIVLPEEKGFFNAALAQINLPRVVNRATARDTEIGQLTTDQKTTEGFWHACENLCHRRSRLMIN